MLFKRSKLSLNNTRHANMMRINSLYHRH